MLENYYFSQPNSVLFCSLFESHFARKDAWAIHVKLKLGDLYYTKPLCSARLKYVEKCEVSQFLALKLMLLLRWFTVLFPSCSTSLPSTVLPRSTLLERTVVFCVPVYWQKYLSGAHWVRWVRCSPGSFLRGERNAWEEERWDILWIIYEEWKWAFCSFKLSVELSQELLQRFCQLLNWFATSLFRITY